MNKPVRPEVFAKAQAQRSVDELLRGFNAGISYRALEPRIAFDGAAAATAAATADQQQATTEPTAANAPADVPAGHAAETAELVGDGAAPGEAAHPADKPQPGYDLAGAIANASNPTAANPPVSIVFIDNAVDNISQLISSIDANSEIVMIDHNSGGLEQIASYLSGRSNVASIHIISHGETGTLHLGSETLSSSNLATHQAELATIGKALTDDGDILLYGCDVAFGDAGSQFADRFAELTGADVAASVDDTGSSELGANWTLEHHTGVVETDGLVLNNWQGVLAPTSATLDWQNVGNHTFGAAGTNYTVGGLTNAITIRTTGTGSITNDSTFATGGTGDPGLELRASTTSTTNGQTTEIIFNATPLPLGAKTVQFDIRNIDASAGGWDDRIIVQAYDRTGTLLLGTNITATPRQTAGQTYSITSLANGQQFDGNIDGASDNAPYDSVGISITSSTGADVGRVTIQYVSGTAGTSTGRIVISDITFTYNLAPTAVADSFTTVHDTAVTINVRANDTDPNSDTLAVTKINGTSILSGGPGVAVTGGVVTLVASGNLVFTPTANYAGSPSFVYTVADGYGGEATATVSGTVTNTAPVVDLDGGTAGNNFTATYTENSAPISIAGATDSITDTDDTNMESSSVTLTNQQTGDRLLVNGSAATTGTIGTITWTRTDTTVTFTGTATKAQYAAAIQQVQFENTTDTPSTTARTINTIVNDGTVTSNTAVTTINIDRAPDPVNDAFAGNEDTAISANVLTNDTDIGDGAGTPPLSIVTGPANGTLTSFNTTTGAFVYTPVADFNGTDTFTYRYTDSDGDSKTATVTLTINPINDAPTQVVAASYGPVAEDASLSITGISVADVDGTPLTTTLTVTNGRLNLASLVGVTVTGDGTGTMTIAGTAAAINSALAGLSFTPTADYNGTSTFTVATSDGALSTATASRTITISPVVDIANDSVTTNEDTAVTFSPLTNDSFENPGRTISAINGSAITAGGAGVVLAGVGTVTLDASGNLTFTPVANYNGTPSFTYTVTSGGVTETATVNMTVASVNDAPTQTVPVAQTTAEDTAQVISGASVADVDGDTLTTTLTIPAGSGVLSVVTGGGATISGGGTTTVTISGTAAQINSAIASITYTPTADFNGSASLSISTTDGSATILNTVSVTVTPVADITNDTITATEDVAAAFNVLTGTGGANADNFEGSPSVTSVTQPPNGTVTFAANGAITYTPAGNFNGTDSFTYTVTSGGVTETATVTVNVAAVNDAPMNTVPGAQTTTEDTNVVFRAANGNAITVADIDSNVTTTLTVANGALTLGTISGVTVTGNGSGTVTVSGTPAAVTAVLAGLSFAPTADWNGSTTLNISTSDGVAAATISTVAITVSPVADIVSNSVTTAEDTAATFNVLTNDNFENAGATVSAVTQPAHGSVTIGSGGDVTYTPASNYNGSDSFTYTVTSGGVTETTTVTLSVTAVNDAPVAGMPSAQSNNDGATASYSVGALFSDVDGDALTFSASGLPLGLSINPTTGQISGTIDIHASTGGAGGVYSVSVTGTDPSGASITRTLNWTVSNPAPVAFNDTFTGTEDTPLSGNVLTNDSDPDGDALSVVTTPVTAPTHGSLILNSDGTFTYTPNADYVGPDSFTYTLRDADGATTTATVTLNVNPTNDSPVISAPPAVTATEDTPLSFGGANAIAITDIDSASITTTLSATNGTLTLASATGVTIAGSGTGTLQLVGSPSDVTAAIAAMTYQAPADYNGLATLTVSSTDGIGSNSVSIALTVTPVADITPDAVSVNEDSTISFNVLTGTNGATADNFESPAASVTTVTQGAHGTVSIGAGGVLTYTPAADYNGTDTFTYTVTSGGVTETTSVTVTVNAVNDAPTQVLPPAQSGTEDTAVIFSGANGNQITIGDIDSGSVTTTVSVPLGSVSAISTVGVTITGNGTGSVTLAGSPAAVTAALNGLSYAPVSDANGSVTLSVSTTDGVAAPISGSVAITLAPVADIANDTAATNEDAPVNIAVLGNDTFENPGRAVTSVTNGANGTVTLNGDGTVTYTPNANFNGSDTFTYTVTSGGVTETATVSVTVNPVNDPPTQVVPAAQTTPEDLGLVFSGATGNAIQVADLDGGSLTTTVSVTNGTINLGSVSGVTVSGNGTGSVVISGTAAAINAALNGFTYSPTADYYGGAVISVVTSDGVATVSNTVAVAVTPVVDITADTVSTSEDAPVTFNVSTNDSFENAAAVIASFTQAANGVVTIGTGGQMTYTPSANYNGPDSFTYTVTSGGVTETTTVTINVAPVNDAAVLVVPPGQATNEDTSLVFSSANGNAISVSDIDGDNLTVTLSGTNGLLTLGSITGVTVSGNGTGTVTVMGSAAAVTAALNGLSFAPSADFNGPAVINVSIADGTVTSSSSIGVAVSPVSDIVSNTVSTNEDTSVTFNVLANDNFESPAASVTSITQGASGTVSFLADGTVVYMPDTNFNGTDTFTYTVTSGGVTETTTITVNVGDVNDAPTTAGLANRINQDGQTVSVNVAASFSDQDAADILTYSATGLPPGLSLNPTTGIISGTIDRNASQTGPYSITVTASDGHPGGTVSTSFNWSISNPAPTANNDTASLPEDTSASINLLANDTDPDSDPLIVTAATAGNGTVSINPDGTIQYTPNANFNGTDTIVYNISDGNGGVSTATVTVTIFAVNDAPTTSGLGNLVDNDSSSVNIDVSSAFNDLDGDTLTYSVTGLPAGLTFNPATGVISGTIDSGASFPSGDQSYPISVTASDGNGGSVITSFTWRVLNLPPTASNDTVTTPEDTPVIATVLTNDHDPDNDPLTITEINGQPITVGGPAIATANGNVKLLTDAFGNQVLMFTPNANFNGVETLTYRTSDGNAGFDTALLTINVVPQNDAPTADTLANLANLDSDTVSIGLGQFFHDIDTPDGDTLTFSALGLPAGLTINPATGTISGTIAHSASQSGPYTVVVKATDSAGANVSQTFTWNVTNPAPTALNDSRTIAENVNISAAAATGLIANDTDPDSDPLTVAAINGNPASIGQPVAGSAGGLFTVNADGSYTFDQNGDFENLPNGQSRVTTVTYRLSDGDGGFATATLSVTINGVNDAPVATPLSPIATVDSAPLTLNAASAFSDIDGDTLTFSVSGLPAGLTINPTTGIISGTIDHSASQSGVGGVYSVTVTASDGQGSTTPVTFTITVTNPAPSAGDDVATTNEDVPVSSTVAGNDSDPDGDALTFAKATNPANGTLVFNANGTYTYTPNANFNGTDSFTYTVTDIDGAVKTQTVTITVNAVNDAPSNSGPVAPQTVNDRDTISNNIAGLFSDVDGDALTYSVTGLPAGLSLNPTTGQVTGTIDRHASQVNGGHYTVVYTATDANGASTSVSVDVTVLNPVPVSTALANTSGIDGTTASIATSTSFSDPDGDTLSYSATGLPAGLSINPVTGLISGTVSNAASVGGPSNNGVYSIAVSASDGDGGTTSRTFVYTVTNPVPTTVNDAFSGTEDTSISGNVSLNDSDADNDALTFAVTTAPTNGTVTMNSGGTFTYTPNANFNGTETFSYTVTDANGATAVATVTLTISPVNDLPVANNVAQITPEDMPISGTLVATDVDADTLTFTKATNPLHGSVVVNTNGMYVYTPAANYNGPDSFTFTVSDGNGGTVTRTVSITVTPVNDVPIATNNSYSVNEDTTLTIAASGILGNDSDVDLDPLTAILVSGPSHGTLTVNPNGSFNYTPDANYNGPDSFTYKANDGLADSNIATVNITVNSVNDAPVAVDDIVPVTEDMPVSGNVLGNDADADGDALSVTQFVIGGTTYTPGSTATIPGVGTLTISSTGAYTFNPAANYNGPVPVATYTVTDGTLTDTATLTLGPVAPVNDGPVVLDEARTVVENTLTSGNVLSNDTDADNDVLSVTDFTINGTTYAPGTLVHLAEGDLVVNSNGTYSFMPTINYNGPVPAVTYTVIDGNRGSDIGQLTLNVSATNDPPVAFDDIVSVTEDTPAIGNVLANDTDPEGDSLSVTQFVIGGTTYAPGTTATIAGVGTLTISSAGAFTFTPAANYNGPVPVVTYTVTDGTSTDTGALTLGPVTPVNDNPTAVNDAATGNEDTPIAGNVLGNDTDADGDVLVVADTDGNPANGITPVTGPAHGTLTLSSNGTFNYTPAANFHGTDSFTYRISDGHGGFAEATVSLTVNPVNDAPVATNGTLTTPEDQPFTGTLPAATDVDGDALTYSKASNPAHGVVIVNANGTYTYTPNANYNGADSFTYSVSDGHGGSTTRTVTVLVTPVNDATGIKPITPPVSIDSGKVSFDVSAFTKDVDGDNLTYNATGLPPGLSINPASGLITGTITRDASKGGPYTVTLTVDDGHGGVVTQTFVWPVTNPAPIARDDTATVKTGKPVTVPVLSNDSDPDGDPLTVTRASAANGTVEILPNGSIKYIPRPGFVGTDRITYVISDGNGGTAIASVTITVADDAYNEKPPVFGVYGPEHHDDPIPGRTIAAPPSITADGAVVEAVFEIGELRSIASQLSADGVVLAAANGIRSLGGVASLSAEGAVVETIRAERAREILHTAGLDRGFQEYKLDGLPGFSLRNNVPGNLAGLSGREQVIIESIVRDDTLIIQISNTLESGSKRIVDYRITQADGKPLPQWLDLAGKDLLIGRRDANAEVIKLRVEAVYSDGSVIAEEVKIDTATGEIQPLVSAGTEPAAPPLFKDQFRSRAMLSPDQIKTLSRAISR